jgi:hypothetical protein
MIDLDKWEMLELCVLQLYSKILRIIYYLEYLIMEIYMYLCMELLYMFTVELVLVGIYLSAKILRKLVDYQWNTVYFVFILERLPGYTDNRKELGHRLGYGPNSDLHN